MADYFLDVAVSYSHHEPFADRTFARAPPIYTVIDAGRNDGTSGLLSTGLQMPLVAGLNLVSDGEATAFRNGDAYAVNLALTHTFWKRRASGSVGANAMPAIWRSFSTKAGGRLTAGSPATF